MNSALCAIMKPVTPVTPWGALYALSSIVVVLGVTSHARASCAPEEPRILWAYPPDGATNVPVDADFFVLLNVYGQRPTVTYNDVQAYDTFHGARFLLDPLTPDTEYVVRVSIADGGSTTTLETRFTTGRDVTPVVATPTLTSYTVDSLLAPQIPHTCSSVLFALDCFDTGQDSVVRLMPTGEATLWLVERTGPGADGGGQPVLTVWPGDCGPPPIVLQRERIGVDPPCVRVTSVSASGELRSSGALCLATSPMPRLDTGCAVGGGASRVSLAWLLVGVGLARMGWSRRHLAGRHHQA